jgi:glycerol kinase
LFLVRTRPRGWILAIDQGTTGTRSMVVDAEGSPVAMRYRTHSQITPHPGWVEHDPEEIWRNVELTASSALAAASLKASDVAGMGIANQGETVMAWDAASGRPVANSIVWQCDRTGRAMERLKKNAGAARRIHRISGLTPDCYFSASKMRWLYENVEECRKLSRAKRLRMGTLDTWLIWKLSGGSRFITDATTASRTLLMNLRTLEWSPELLDLFRVDEGWLPRIGSTTGHLAEASIAGATVPVLASAVDQQSALYGQCCFRAGMTKCTFGTGAFLLMHTGETPVWSKRGLLTTVARAGHGVTTYALDGGVYVAGSAVTWMRDNLHLITTDAEAGRLAESVPDAGGVVCIPSLAGLAAPHWERRARGMFHGLTSSTTAAHLARAILEGVALRVYSVAETMARESGQPLQAPLRVDGGLTRNRFFLQFLSGLLNCELAIPPCDETTALGVAWMAGLEAGLYRNERELESRWKPALSIEPQMSSSERAGHIGRHKRAIKHLLQWSRDAG